MVPNMEKIISYVKVASQELNSTGYLSAQDNYSNKYALEDNN
jgi:hypothetical protein